MSNVSVARDRAVPRVMGVLVLGVALGMSGSAFAGGDRLKAGEESTFAAPRMSAPPKIDGTIDPAEWREAVAVSGTTDIGTDLLSPQPVTFYLAWDARHLYMACRIYLPGSYKPRNYGGRSPGGADCFDDGLECLFKPMGRNVSAQNQATEFKFNIGSLGYGGTYTRLVVGQIMSNWEPKFHSAVRLTDPGSAPNGGKWWELETAFALEDFELAGENRAGDQWKLMLGLNHLPMVNWYQGRIPCVGGYFTPDGKSVVTLVENTPAVQMLVDSLSNVASDGTAAMTVKAYNPAKAAAQVKLDIDVAGKIVKSETLALPAGGEKTFTLNEKMPPEIKDGRLTLKAVSDRGTTLLSYTAPFEVGRYNFRTQAVPDPAPNEFPFLAKFNPVRGLLLISGDSYFLPDPAAVKGLHYDVRHKDSGKTIASGDITKAQVWRFEDILTLKDLKPDLYEATATLQLADGKRFGPRSATFEKKDEAKVFSAWWGKDPGNSERVLPPFEAIRRQKPEDGSQKAEGDAFACWGRQYTFDALGLPVAVRSQGSAVLAAPARIVVSAGGRQTVILVGKPKITERKDWRVRFEGRAEGAGLAFSAAGWLEQDGLVCVDLTYQPTDGKAVTVDALTIEYPVAQDVAECLTSVGPGNNFAAMTATVLPAGKQGKLWSTFDTGRPGAQMKIGSFYPHVWLGNEQRGFQWWADNDKGWCPDDDVPAHEVAREGGAVVLKNHIIGKPVELTGPRTLTFTWIASPFKPLPKGWRMIAATEDGTFGPPFRGQRVNPKTGLKYKQGGGLRNWINPESLDPEDWGRLWQEQRTKGIPAYTSKKNAEGKDEWVIERWLPSSEQVVKARRPFDLYGSRNGMSLQHMSFQLHGYGAKSIEDAVFAYFGDEWRPDSLDTWNTTYTDYAMYLFDRAFGEGGVVETYWDLSFPTLFKSSLCGLAYPLPDGRWQPGYDTLNCRRFYQRLWAVQDKHGLNPGAVGCHSTQSYMFPTLPWIDAVLDGERDWNIDISEMDWVDYYPKERMRAMSVPHTWGVGICWMSNFASTNAQKRVAAKTAHAEYVWMHDSWLNPYLDYPHVTRMPQSILDWGLNGADVVYVPYWRNPYAAAGDPDLLVSLWRIPGEAAGRILVGVFNYNRRATKDAEITLDLAKLGLAEGSTGGRSLDLRDLSREFMLGYDAKGTKEALAVTNPQLGSAAEFDGAKGILRIKGLGPHRGRFIGIGATETAAETRITAELPAWAAAGGAVAGVRDHGFLRGDTKYFGPGQAPGVSCTNAAIQVGMWQLPDRVLLSIFNANTNAAEPQLKLDLGLLGVAPKLSWQDFIGVRPLYAEKNAPDPVLDFYGQSLVLKRLPPRSGRLIALRRY